MHVELREEHPADAPAIHRLNTAAFGTDAEARLVDALRDSGGLTLSLVAQVGGELVGHIAFSPVVVEGSSGTAHGMGLAPMAVAPGLQRQGIGGRLIAEGLRRIAAARHPFCVVLGHAEYYPRHGFIRASVHGIRWEKPVPDEVFFVRELTPGGLAGVEGIVRYRSEFDAL
jgi:putative acetyltransferase